MRSSKKKILLSLIVIFVFAISATAHVSAESGTMFTFTLEDKDSYLETETPAPDTTPSTDNNDHSSGTIPPSPQTGDESLLIYWSVLVFSAGGILAILYFGKSRRAEK